MTARQQRRTTMAMMTMRTMTTMDTPSTTMIFRQVHTLFADKVSEIFLLRWKETLLALLGLDSPQATTTLSSRNLSFFQDATAVFAQACPAICTCFAHLVNTSKSAQRGLRSSVKPANVSSHLHMHSKPCRHIQDRTKRTAVFAQACQCPANCACIANLVNTSKSAQRACITATPPGASQQFSTETQPPRGLSTKPCPRRRCQANPLGGGRFGDIKPKRKASHNPEGTPYKVPGVTLLRVL